jgi:hypothetical protein
MLKNKYDLCDIVARKELFEEYLTNKMPSLDFSQFDENINFLCKIGLSDQWLTVVAITIGELICPNNLPSETSMYSVGIDDLLTLGNELKVFDSKTIASYIQRLNAESFTRMSVLSEIKIASAYVKRGCIIDIEPPNGRIGKSGLEGKSDVRVKFNDEWIYFEIIRETDNYSAPDSYKISKIVGYIEEKMIKSDLLPRRTKIEAIIIDKNKVLSKDWGYRLFQHLQLSPLKIKSPKEFDGIRYVLQYRIPREPIFCLLTPVTNLKKNFTKRIKNESNQIPRQAKGVIAMELNSSLNVDRFHAYALEFLRKHVFYQTNILAMILWYKNDYRIIHKSVNDDLLELLAMPFQV